MTQAILAGQTALNLGDTPSSPTILLNAQKDIKDLLVNLPVSKMTKTSDGFVFTSGRYTITDTTIRSVASAIPKITQLPNSISTLNPEEIKNLLIAAAAAFSAEHTQQSENVNVEYRDGTFIGHSGAKIAVSSIKSAFETFEQHLKVVQKLPTDAPVAIQTSAQQEILAGTRDINLASRPFSCTFSLNIQQHSLSHALANLQLLRHDPYISTGIPFVGRDKITTTTIRLALPIVQQLNTLTGEALNSYINSLSEQNIKELLIVSAATFSAQKTHQSENANVIYDGASFTGHSGAHITTTAIISAFNKFEKHLRGIQNPTGTPVFADMQSANPVTWDILFNNANFYLGNNTQMVDLTSFRALFRDFDSMPVDPTGQNGRYPLTPAHLAKAAEFISILNEPFDPASFLRITPGHIKSYLIACGAYRRATLNNYTFNESTDVTYDKVKFSANGVSIELKTLNKSLEWLAHYVYLSKKILKGEMY